MRKDCDSCKHDEFVDEYCIGCIYGDPPSKWEAADYYRPDTNGDRIRSMSDEELACFLLMKVVNEKCYGICHGSCTGNDCISGIVKWLNSEYKEK